MKYNRCAQSLVAKKHIGFHRIKSFVTSLSFLIFGVFLTPITQAASVEVQWTETEKYRDVKAGTGSSKKFRERTFKTLEKHLTKLAARLPETQLLKVNVTDLDLAGRIDYVSNNSIRVVKEIDIPSIEFSYQLLNADESVDKSGEVDLKDMNFMRHTSLKYNHESLSYEKRMLESWFYKTFK